MTLGVLLLCPDQAKALVAFRHTLLAGAEHNRAVLADNNDLEGLTRGLKFPWQSSTSGLEVAPPLWESQEHINSVVAFGQYLFWIATRDDEFLRNHAFPIARGVCEYFEGRVALEDGRYHYRGVVPADEFPFPSFVDDNAYTNLFAARILEITAKWAEILGEPVPDAWHHIASNMYYPFDEQLQRVLEFEGYRGQEIKQADTDLLTFPVEWPLPPAVKRNNMEYYFTRLPPNHIMMASAIYGVVACELGLVDQASGYYRDMFPHFHADLCHIMSEAPNNDCAPFLTGAGGFLQFLQYGLAGLRLRVDGLLFAPCLVPEVPEIVFRRLQYQGNTFTLRVWACGARFSITAHDDPVDFLVYFREGCLYHSPAIAVPEPTNDLWLDTGYQEHRTRLCLGPGGFAEFQKT
jgi:trehalose/maltose hydrolase-like predicted phosphorylase